MSKTATTIMVLIGLVAVMLASTSAAQAYEVLSEDEAAWVVGSHGGPYVCDEKDCRECVIEYYAPPDRCVAYIPEYTYYCKDDDGGKPNCDLGGEDEECYKICYRDAGIGGQCWEFYPCSFEGWTCGEWRGTSYHICTAY